MQEIASVAKLPASPAVYALYGGKGASLHAAYVGVADSLRGRVEQHLVRRDSSVTTRVAAACLNVDAITEVRWWVHPRFAEREALEAAELVAFDLLEPTLRSRGSIRKAARQLYEDEAFAPMIRQLLQGEPAGRLVLPTLQDALARIDTLEQRLATVEAELRVLRRADIGR